jgi:hypothetical protein
MHLSESASRTVATLALLATLVLPGCQAAAANPCEPYEAHDYAQGFGFDSVVGHGDTTAMYREEIVTRFIIGGRVCTVKRHMPSNGN